MLHFLFCHKVKHQQDKLDISGRNQVGAYAKIGKKKKEEEREKDRESLSRMNKLSKIWKNCSENYKDRYKTQLLQHLLSSHNFKHQQDKVDLSGRNQAGM